MIKTNPSTRNNYKGCIKGFYYSKKNNKSFWHRSSFELLAFNFLDECSEVKSYCAEPYHIRYKRNGEEIWRAYMPDIIINVNGVNVLVEIKPEFKVQEFIETKQKYLNTKEKLIIITEKQLINKKTFNEFITNTCY